MVELERMIRDVLASPQYGVNAILGLSTFDTTDVIPPTIAQIRCTADRQLTFTDQDLSAGVALVITVHTPSEGSGEVFSGCRDYVADVRIECAVRPTNADAGQGTQAAQYTCGPSGFVAKSLAYGLFSSRFRDLNGVRGSHHVKSASRVTFDPTPRRLQGAIVTGATVFQMQMRDVAPEPLVVESLTVSPTPGVIALISLAYAILPLTRVKQPAIVRNFVSVIDRAVKARLAAKGHTFAGFPRLKYKGVLWTPVEYPLLVTGFVANIARAVQRRLQQKGRVILLRPLFARLGIVPTPVRHPSVVHNFVSVVQAAVRRRIAQFGHTVEVTPRAKPRLVTTVKLARRIIKHFVSVQANAVQRRLQQKGHAILLRPLFARLGIVPTPQRHPDLVHGFAATIAAAVRRRIAQKGHAVTYGPVAKPRLVTGVKLARRIVRHFASVQAYAVRRRIAQFGHTIEVTPRAKPRLVPTPVRRSRVTVHGYTATVQAQVRRRIAQFGHVIDLTPATIQAVAHGIPTRRPRQAITYTLVAGRRALYARQFGRGFPQSTSILTLMPILVGASNDEPFYWGG